MSIQFVLQAENSALRALYSKYCSLDKVATNYGTSSANDVFLQGFTYDGLVRLATDFEVLAVSDEFCAVRGKDVLRQIYRHSIIFDSWLEDSSFTDPPLTSSDSFKWIVPPKFSSKGDPIGIFEGSNLNSVELESHCTFNQVGC